MILQNPRGSSWKTRSTQETSVFCQMSFLLIVTIYYPKLAVFPLWDSYFSPLWRNTPALDLSPSGSASNDVRGLPLHAKYH